MELKAKILNNKTIELIASEEYERDGEPFIAVYAMDMMGKVDVEELIKQITTEVAKAKNLEPE